MKKRTLLLISAALVLTSCTIGTPKTSEDIESQSSLVAGEQVIVEESDEKTSYRMDIANASGWNKDDEAMDGKPKGDGTPTEESMSSWTIEGAIPEGKYDVYVIGHMTDSAHSDRHWNNHSKQGAIDPVLTNPDTSEEADYRYFLRLDDSANDINPNTPKTWGELGYDTANDKPGLMIKGMTMPKGAKKLHLLHGDIGYPLVIKSLRLVPVEEKPEDSSAPSSTQTSTPASSGVGSLAQSEITNSSEQSAATNKDGAITLTKNHEGAEVSILHPGVQQYCDDMYAAYDRQDPSHANLYKIQEVAKSKSGYMCPNVFASSYQGPASDNDRDHFQPIQLEWTAPTGYTGKYTVKYSTKADLSAWNGVVTTTNKAELVNLLTDTVYYWKVETETGNHDSAIGSFKTKGSFRTIQAGAAYNVRDMGGKMTSSGQRTKQGLIYRGGELTDHWFAGNSAQDHIITCDATTVRVLHDQLKVRNEIDIRSPGRETDYQNRSYLGSDVTFSQLATGSGFGTMWNVSDQNNKNNLKTIFKMFGQATKDAAVYYHCWGGADRTGTSCFILNGLLGVSFLEACMDYEFTSFDTIHTRLRTEMVRDAAGYTYDFTTLISTIKSSSYYTQSTTKTFQDVCYRWCKGKLGLTDNEIDQIKNNLLEPLEA